jgi:hypothetical protein
MKKDIEDLRFTSPYPSPSGFRKNPEKFRRAIFEAGVGV